MHSGCVFEKLESIEIDLLVNVGGKTPHKILRYGKGKKQRVQEMGKWWKIYRRWGMKYRSCFDTDVQDLEYKDLLMTTFTQDDQSKGHQNLRDKRVIP